MAGLWFDDAEIGMTFETPRRTVTEADVINFAGVSGDFHTLHTDAQTMRESQFGERIAHGSIPSVVAESVSGAVVGGAVREACSSATDQLEC